jgi:hypothetical protein
MRICLTEVLTGQQIFRKSDEPFVFFSVQILMKLYEKPSMVNEASFLY